MKKCKFSIHGECTNEHVACDKCASTEIEMGSCSPYQHSTTLYGESWGIEIKQKEGETDHV